MSIAPQLTLQVILCVTAWTLVLWFVIRPLLLRYIRWTGSFVVGPTQGAITIIVLLVLVSSQITNILGCARSFAGLR